MARKLILLSSVVFLLLASVNASLAETADSKVTALTLEKAYELALENNIDLKKSRLDYEQALIDAEQARYNARQIEAEDVNSLQTAQTKYVSTKQKELAEKVAEQAYEMAKEQAKHTVQRYYYDVIKAESQVKVREAAVKRAQEQLSLTQKKYKAGTAIKTDVNRAELSLSSAKADLANGQRDYKNAQITLNKAIGLGVDTEVKATLNLKYEEVTLPTVEELTAKALESRLDLQRARNSELIAQMNYDYVVSYQAPNTFTARKNKLDLDRVKLDAVQQEQTVKADVIAAIFQIQKADEVVQLTKKSLDQAKDNQALVNRRYEIGVGTLNDVMTASIDLAEAEIKYTEALYNHVLAKNQLSTVVFVAK